MLTLPISHVWLGPVITFQMFAWMWQPDERNITYRGYSKMQYADIYMKLKLILLWWKPVKPLFNFSRIYSCKSIESKWISSVAQWSFNMTRIYTVSRSQNSPPEGNGVHFMFEVVSRLLFFSEESDGADHFFWKKGTKHAHFGPFLAHEWTKLKKPMPKYR